MYCDYKTKLLYRQHTMSDEGHDVDASVYALTWKHPASMGSITTRTRLTIVTNFIDNEVPNVYAVNIEIWRETGWLMLDEYFDDSLQQCYSVLDVERICLKVLEAFFVGNTDDDDENDPIPEPRPSPKRTPVGRMKRTTKRKKPIVEEKKKEEQLPAGHDDPSFDWI